MGIARPLTHDVKTATARKTRDWTPAQAIRARVLTPEDASGLLGPAPGGQAFRDERDAPLQAHIDDSLRAGMSHNEARRDGLVELGGVDLAKARGDKMITSRLTSIGVAFALYGSLLAHAASAQAPGGASAHNHHRHDRRCAARRDRDDRRNRRCDEGHDGRAGDRQRPGDRDVDGAPSRALRRHGRVSRLRSEDRARRARARRRQ